MAVEHVPGSVWETSDGGEGGWGKVVWEIDCKGKGAEGRPVDSLAT